MIRSSARARRWTESRGSISARGLVPFLDTLFNLLFALLALHALQRAPAALDLLRLRLPSVERGGEEGGAVHGLVLALDAGGEVRTPGATRALRDEQELDGALAALVHDGVPEEIPIEIRADALCPQGVVVELLQHLRVLGFADVRLQAVARKGGVGLFGGVR